MHTDIVIDVENLEVNYEQVNALVNVNFQVAGGEFIGIIGPNGGGKTTLVKAILGLLSPIGGKAEVKEGQVVGYVPQLTTFDRSFPVSVEEVIQSGHLPRRLKLWQRFSEKELRHGEEVMKRLGILGLRKRQIGELSGGQMQRVLIARALMNHPSILILDEPTSGVDEAAKKDIYTLLRELNQEITMLMITHDTEEILEFLDKVIYIYKTAHIHVMDKAAALEEECCPIDWYMEGQRIQRELMEQEGK